MVNDDTIPTIAELKGNTILELLSNVYTTLKNAIFRKQNKLIAGDNIVINGDTISAIEGGTPVLEDYYTKEEVNEIASELSADINDKADADDVYDKTETYNKTEVYTKTEVDTLVGSLSGDVEVIESGLGSDSFGKYFLDDLKDGDVIVCNIYNDNNALQYSGVASISKSSYNLSGSSVIGIGYTDLNNFSVRTDNILISYNTTYNKWYLGVQTAAMTITNNSIALTEIPTRSGINVDNSKITIYRKKEVTE